MSCRNATDAFFSGTGFGSVQGSGQVWLCTLNGEAGQGGEKEWDCARHSAHYDMAGAGKS